MKIARTLLYSLVALGLVSATVVSADAEDLKSAHLALHKGGTMTGVLVGADKKPLAQQKVTVSFQGKPVAAATTDAQGRFAIQGLRGGVHTVATASSQQAYQLWAHRTAPPSAARMAVIESGPIVRGQCLEGINKKKLLAYAGLGVGIAAGVWAIDYNEPGS